MSVPLVQIDDLTIGYQGRGGPSLPVVRNVSWNIAAGEAVGLVGESGCGKSTLSTVLLGYLRSGSCVLRGDVRFDGQQVLQLERRALEHLRGRRVALVPQNASQALTPTMRIGEQATESLTRYQRIDSATARQRVVALFHRMRLSQPEALLRRYPHELSGGQQQRVAIAMALARQPDLLVLDEPTTGLDVTTQAHVLALLDSYRREHGMTMLYVSHDLGVIAHMSERVAVMYAGELVEMASAAALFGTPHHPYTRGLLASIPRRSLDRLPQALPGQPPTPPVPSRPACAFAPRCAFADAQCDLVAPPLVTLPTAPDHAVRCHHWAQVIATETRSSASPAPPRKASNGTTPSSPLLRLDDIAISYGRTGSVLSRWQRAAPPDTVGNMSLGVQRGETLALVGESGSGKTTIVRAVAGLKQPHVGRITFGDADITSPVDRRPAGVRRAIQLIFQNPDASLNPRQTIAEILAQPLRLYFGLNRTDCARRAQMLLDQVRLSPSYLYRFPNQLSGGEKQRVAIARAFAADPALVLCDEITSALDVSVQAAVLEVLAELQAQQGVTYLFITHDLAVVRAIAERVAVLYHGRLCEVGSVAQVYAPQWHPYTAMLLDAVLEPVPPTQSADVPAPISDPAPPAQGCPFQRRCPHHIGPICDEEPPPWQQGSSGHTIRCHIPLAELVGNYSRRCKNLYDR